MPAAKPSAGARLLQEHIEKDAPLRELSVASFVAGITSGTALLALSLGPLIGWRLSISLTVLLAALATYYWLLRYLLKRGWYRPFIRWVNVGLEVSAPSMIFLVDSWSKGPEYALTAPPLVVWGTLVGLSGLRSNRALAIGAGAIAAAEYLALYLFVALPHLPADALVTLQPALFVPRVVLLFSSGVVTAVFVTHLNRRAEEALSAVRERDLLGKYVLHERIGAGGMAEVFRATYSPEGGFEKLVAIKKVLPAVAEVPEFIAMFRAEADLCSRLAHANIVQVFDFGRFKETYFLAMEYVEGLPLHKVLRAHSEKGLPLSAVTFLGVELASALEYLHSRRGPDGKPLNLMHRDLNPPNILISKQGDVKLTDFGIARATAVANLPLTQAGLVRGKPGYFAPEQLTGATLDPRVDLFALGITLWESLMGVPLYPSKKTVSAVEQVFTQSVIPPSAARREVPPELDAVVVGLLQQDPNARTQSARSVLKQLMAITGPAAAFPDGQLELRRALQFAHAELEKRGRAVTERFDALTDVSSAPSSEPI